MITSYEEARAFLEEFIPFIVNHRITPGSKEADDQLGRMRYLLNLLDNPQEKFRSIVVSGTSGKGSVSYLTAQMLAANGYSTGLTLSPHLEKMTERIQYGQAPHKILPISDEKFLELLNEIVPSIQTMKQSQYGSPSYYEILLCLAFIYFAEKSVDIAIVEVGIEGRNDATNLVNPLIFVLTNISLDHTALLGDTVEKIADEASHRIKNLVARDQLAPTVVSGVTQPLLTKLITQRTKESKSQLKLLSRDYEYVIQAESLTGVEFTFSAQEKLISFKNSRFFVSLRGSYQAENAATALATVEQLMKYGFSFTEEKIKSALASSEFAGRFETIDVPARNLKKTGQPCQFILDGAHNPAKMEAFLKSFQKLFPDRKKIFIVGFKKGKDFQDMVNKLAQVADCIIFTRFNVTMDWGKNMGMEVQDIKKQVDTLKKTLQVSYEEDVNVALNQAVELFHEGNNAEQKPLIVITGSLYLVGEVREILNRF